MVDANATGLRLGHDVSGDVAGLEIERADVEAAGPAVERDAIERLAQVQAHVGAGARDVYAPAETVRGDGVHGVRGVLDVDVEVDAWTVRRRRDAVDAGEHAGARRARRAR